MNTNNKKVLKVLHNLYRDFIILISIPKTVSVCVCVCCSDEARIFGQGELHFPPSAIAVSLISRSHVVCCAVTTTTIYKADWLNIYMRIFPNHSFYSCTACLVVITSSRAKPITYHTTQASLRVTRIFLRKDDESGVNHMLHFCCTTQQ